MKTLISVIIPFCKEIDDISRAVESVISQNVGNRDIKFEILIGNDGEYAESEIRSKLPRQAVDYVKIFKNQKHKGAGNARNAALDGATGQAIAFLDADDYWVCDKILGQMKLFDQGCSFIVTSYQFEQKKIIVSPPRSIGRPIDIFRKLGIGTSTVLVSGELLRGERFQNVRFGQDIDLWYRLAKKKEFVFGSIESCGTVYGEMGRTRNKFVQLYYFARVLLKNNVPILVSVPIICRYSLRGLYNHFLRGRKIFGVKIE